MPHPLHVHSEVLSNLYQRSPALVRTPSTKWVGCFAIESTRQTPQVEVLGFHKGWMAFPTDRRRVSKESSLKHGANFFFMQPLSDLASRRYPRKLTPTQWNSTDNSHVYRSHGQRSLAQSGRDRRYLPRRDRPSPQVSAETTKVGGHPRDLHCTLAVLCRVHEEAV